MISCTCSIGSAYCSAPSVNTTSCRAWVFSDIGSSLEMWSGAVGLLASFGDQRAGPVDRRCELVGDVGQPLGGPRDLLRHAGQLSGGPGDAADRGEDRLQGGRGLADGAADHLEAAARLAGVALDRLRLVLGRADGVADIADRGQRLVV